MKTKTTLTINEGRREVFVNGKEKRLAAKEFDILVELKNRGIILSRAVLLNNIWDSERSLDLDTRTVDQHISRLRRKIGKDFILTCSGFGYKFAA